MNLDGQHIVVQVGAEGRVPNDPIRESGPGTRLAVSPDLGPDFKFSKLRRRSAPDYQFSGTQPDC
jgi:hypothetical protein